jgi:hypothetical protein
VIGAGAGDQIQPIGIAGLALSSGSGPNVDVMQGGVDGGPAGTVEGWAPSCC